MIGILGKGQLGDMLEDAAKNLSRRCRFYTDFEAPPEAIVPWIQGTTVVTFESENIPYALAAQVAQVGCLRPSLKALQISANRIAEKTCFRDLGIPTVDFMPVYSASDLHTAIVALGYPLILKTTTLGYDGKGQCWLRSAADLENTSIDFSKNWIAEKVIDFSAEVSLIAARRPHGEMCYYPLAENVHRAGILRQTRVGTEITQKYQHLCALAQSAMDKLMAHFDYVGVLTIEFFVTQDGQLLANECAPRVHNSGHWSIEGAQTSQFENHLRAICDLPFGSVDLTYPAVGMINLIGRFPQIEAAPQGPYHWHDYHKSSRENRKLGHVTITSADLVSLNMTMDRLQHWMDHTHAWRTE